MASQAAAEHEKATKALDAAKRLCGEGCGVDESAHAPHREKLELAYAEHVRTSVVHAAELEAG